MINITQLTALRSVQESHMGDKITITRNVLGQDEYGDITYSGIVESGVNCGFRFIGGEKRSKGALILVDYDAEVRLPITVSGIGVNDMITLVSKAGIENEETFKIYGEPQLSSSALKLKLKRIE